MDVAIVVYDGFDDLDAIGPAEVFGHARSLGEDVTAGLYTRTPRDVVTSAHGQRFVPDGVLDPSSDGETHPDLVVVPGGGWSRRDGPGARTEVDRGALPNVVARFHDGGVTVAAVCTGGMVLAHAGVLGDRPAVTHHGALEDLRATGADVRDARVVDDGDIVTAGGITAGIDLALHLLERKIGGDIAQRVATRMEYERRGPVVDG